MDDERPDALHALGYVLQLHALLALQSPLQYMLGFTPVHVATAHVAMIVFAALLFSTGTVLIHERQVAGPLFVLALGTCFWSIYAQVVAAPEVSTGSIARLALERGAMPLVAFVGWLASPRRWLPGRRTPAMVGGSLLVAGFGFLAWLVGTAAASHPLGLTFTGLDWLVSIAMSLVLALLLVRAGLELAGTLPSLGPGRSRVTAYVWGTVLMPATIGGTMLVVGRLATGTWGTRFALVSALTSTLLTLGAPLVTRWFVGPPPTGTLPVRRSDGTAAVAWLVIGTAAPFAGDLVHAFAADRAAHPSHLRAMLDAALVPAGLTAGIAALLGLRRAARSTAVFGAIASAIFALDALRQIDADTLRDYSTPAAALVQFCVLAWLLAPEPGPTLSEVFA